MGYMGFGMRKEVYTRKPKQAFKKVKEVLFDQNKRKKNLSDTEYAELKQLRHERYRQFYQTRLFKFVAVLTGVAITSILLMNTVVADLTHNYQKNQFEQTGIQSYYADHEPDFTKVYSFFNSRKSKIQSFDLGFFDYWELLLKSEDMPHAYDSDSVHLVLLESNWQEKTCIINDGKLMVTGKGFVPKTYDSNWLFEITVKDSLDIDPSVLVYLDVGFVELKNILQLLEDNNWAVYIHADHVKIEYAEPRFGQYDFVFTNSLPPSLLKQKIHPGYALKYDTLEPKKVFWTSLQKED